MSGAVMRRRAGKDVWRRGGRRKRRSTSRMLASWQPLPYRPATTWMMSCVRGSMQVSELSVRSIVLPEECLGYGLVFPFLLQGFAALVSNNEDLYSLN